MKSSSAFPGLIFLVIMVIGAAVTLVLHQNGSIFGAAFVLALAILIASVASSATRVADPWTKAVVLCLGKFRSLEGPGLFLSFR
jgi:regulator of protease activity HflC (stomatin/prohibitin superfamily)